ncbi:MAG: hypothetical protein H6774_00715 [Pseudomonadales bacterium]|nr:hypothetical protein [Candidatus Woesebacteria bacterium]MCB9801589.1 hypothetical protein [Pseudomonadales bacterium]
MLIRKITVLGFCTGLNLTLGTLFFAQLGVALPGFAQHLFYKAGVESQIQQSTQLVITQETPHLDAQQLLATINTQREYSNGAALKENQKLTTVAQTLYQEYKQHAFTTDSVQKNQLESALKDVGYTYVWVGNTIMVGPTTNQGIVEAQFSEDDQANTLTNPDFQEIGVAAGIETLDGAQMGVVVYVLAQPQTTKQLPKENEVVPATSSSAVLGVQTAADIPDDEVITALNAYRQAHDVPPLTTNQNLCTYAEKRAQDLIAAGGLDSHAGFKADFANNTLPESLAGYPGSRFGENLAHQYCKNMTTNESFVAETGTALIEWCFDSSTAGHKEAQLSTDFTNVCVRHADNMYVVLFGD